tara:strand:- start:863 stop:1318 length:456 start_codon:yes stop_codon:yes gene_type:complete
MKKYVYIFILIPFFILGCDYSPIYSNKNDFNFFIEKIEFNGDAEINNLIDKKLKKYQKNANEKKFFISSTSSYSKVSQTKNLSGKTTNYSVIIKITFQIKKGDKTKIFSSTEEFLIKNFSNKFEEINLEKIKKENSVDLIINRLIIYLSQM